MEGLNKDIKKITDSLLNIKTFKGSNVFINLLEKFRDDEKNQAGIDNESQEKDAKKESMISNMDNDISQWKIERIVIDNLPDDYKYAKLEEITKNSILIENGIRLPVFGKQCELHIRRSRLTREASKFIIEEKEFEGKEISTEMLNEPSNIIPAERITKEKVEGAESEIIKEGLQEENQPPMTYSILQTEEKQESTENLNICEKILAAINENYADDNLLEQSSPSPIKNQKQNIKDL